MANQSRPDGDSYTPYGVQGKKGKNSSEKLLNAVNHADTIPNRERAWEMKLSGASLSKIAAALGISKTTASNYINDRLRELSSFHSSTEVERNYQMAHARYEAELEYWMKRREKFPSPKIGALIFRCLENISEIQGLRKISIENASQKMNGAEVLDRVKQVAGRVISPLVAEKLQALPEGVMPKSEESDP